MIQRKICVVTGTRAEYGLLYWLMRGLQEANDFQLQLIVTGTHLSPEFGLTGLEIEAQGFRIDAKVELLLSSDTAVGTAKSIGLGVIGFADALNNLKPDLLVVLGDRFELLAAVQAALPARIPIAHIHGGERSEGAIDESIRHAITKMSHLHFVAAQPYLRRVIQLGESPERVFNVGAPGLDHLLLGRFPDRLSWQSESGFTLANTNFLVTYHPTTLDQCSTEGLSALLLALEQFPEARIIFTKANADAGGRAINKMLAEFVSGRPGQTVLFDNLGSRLYLGLLRLVDLVVGNSSSGLIEAPFFGVPTVNVGQRQAGRLKAASVFDCSESTDSIRQTMDRALAFGREKREVDSPYGRGNSAQLILQILRRSDFNQLIRKQFHDLEWV
ncbi:MAG: UDP-N-acetylglucosamine 2-epimerase (hydrolyzing) [Magnetococcales bacterium]|nr:UDP-N-acetylglucosamine 2-epimerase (hydrolyzing) [Magnetococcales bacterium]